MTSQVNSSVAFSPVLARNLSSAGWERVELLDVVDSTNVHALRDPAPWHLVAAQEQRAGRGRLSRTWQTPPGAAVTMSLTLPLPEVPAHWGWVPLFVGDAVRAALADLLGADRVATKWPNDVLVRDADGEWRKVAGVLCQVAPGPQPLVVAGVGVNVAQTREQLPVPTATSLALAGNAASRDDVLAAVAARVGDSAHSWSGQDVAPLRESVRAHCRTIGRDIEVHTPDGLVERRRGAGIDDDGRLVTRAPGTRSISGSTMTYAVADIVHARLT